MTHDIDKNFVKDSEDSTRGFVTIGIDTDTDQIKYNYLLATSIKLSDPNASVCLIVDKNKSDLVRKNIFTYLIILLNCRLVIPVTEMGFMAVIYGKLFIVLRMTKRFMWTTIHYF